MILYGMATALHAFASPPGSISKEQLSRGGLQLVCMKNRVHPPHQGWLKSCVVASHEGWGTATLPTPFPITTGPNALVPAIMSASSDLCLIYVSIGIQRFVLWGWGKGRWKGGERGSRDCGHVCSSEPAVLCVVRFVCMELCVVVSLLCVRAGLIVACAWLWDAYGYGMGCMLVWDGMHAGMGWDGMHAGMGWDACGYGMGCMRVWDGMHVGMGWDAYGYGMHAKGLPNRVASANKDITYFSSIYLL